MSKLSDLRSKGQSIVLSNDLELELMPMTLDDEADIAEYQEEKQFTKAISLLVKKAIKRAIPEATDDEINNLNKEDLKKVTTAVLEVNGLVSSKNEEAMKNSNEN